MKVTHQMHSVMNFTLKQLILIRAQIKIAIFYMGFSLVILTLIIMDLQLFSERIRLRPFSFSCGHMLSIHMYSYARAF